jgi:hypothetical protein
MSPENSKPEWFQMADADATPPRPKGKRAIRIMALASPLLVLGAGLVFAQTQDSPTALASAMEVPATTSPSPTTVSTPTTTSTPVSSSAPVSQPSPTAQSSSITIKKPAIATMPTGSGPNGGEDEGLRSSDDD